MTDLEQAQQAGIAPWDQVVKDAPTYVIYQDRFPVSKGHLLFVPKTNYIDTILDCYRQAHKYGNWMVIRGDADAYNIGMNMGSAAGQTVMYPHVHLIPRRSGDCEDPVGGIRGVVPGQANYKQTAYQQPV